MNSETHLAITEALEHLRASDPLLAKLAIQRALTSTNDPRVRALLQQTWDSANLAQQAKTLMESYTREAIRSISVIIP